MKSRMLILLIFFSPGILYAYGRPGCGNKDKDKGKVTCRGKSGATSMEAFVFVLPAAHHDKNCKAKKDFRAAVVNFYKWYLQHEDKITTGLSQEDKGKDLMPPFNISCQTLHEYFEVIQEKYADWISGIGSNPAYASPAAAQGAAVQASGGGNIPGDASGNSSTINFSNTAE